MSSSISSAPVGSLRRRRMASLKRPSREEVAAVANMSSVGLERVDGSQHVVMVDLQSSLFPASLASAVGGSRVELPQHAHTPCVVAAAGSAGRISPLAVALAPQRKGLIGLLCEAFAAAHAPFLKPPRNFPGSSRPRKKKGLSSSDDETL